MSTTSMTETATAETLTLIEGQPAASVVSDDTFKAMVAKASKKGKSAAQSADKGLEEGPKMNSTKIKIEKNSLPIKQSTKDGVIVSVLPAVPAGALQTGDVCVLADRPSDDQIIAAAKAIRANRKADPKVSAKREAKTYDVTLVNVHDVCPAHEDGTKTHETYAAHYHHMNGVVKDLKAAGVKMSGNYTTGLYVGVRGDKVVRVEFQKPVGK